MNTIQNISFPRSGHHLLVDCLTAICPGEIRYCEYYTHCNSVPCIDKTTNYQKNHDLSLTLQPSDENYYLVQYRTPLESIVSWYTHYRKRMGTIHGLVREPNTVERWEKYAKRKLEYWKNFIEKWVVKNPPKNVLHIAYSNLVNEPVKELKRTSDFVFKDKSIAMSSIEKVVNERNISTKSDIRRFKFYNADQFYQWEDSVDEYLKFLNLQRVVK